MKPASDQASLSPDAADEYPYGPHAPVLKTRPMADWPADERQWRDGYAGLSLLVVFGIATLLADVAILPLMDEIQERDWAAVWVYATMGILVAQAAALTLWLVWGAGPFLLRLLAHWSLVGLAVTAWLVGFWFAEGSSSLRDACWIVLPALPLFGLAAQAPLWAMRMWLGWRLVGPDEAPATAPTIRDLMLATLIAALSLAAARWVDGGNRLDDEFWTGWLVAITFATGGSVLVAMPAGGCLLGSRRFEFGTLFVTAYAAGAATITCVVVLVLLPTGWRDVWQLVGITTVIFSTLSALLLAGLGARLCGYRLALNRH